MDNLQTEGRNPASNNLDKLSPLEFVRLMSAEDARVLTSVASQEAVIAQAIEAIADRLRNGGRLVYLGAGTSGRLGVLDAAECPPTFNSTPGQVVGLIAGGSAALTRAVEGAEDRQELGEQDLDAIQFSARDVLVGIATSGRTPYVLGAVRHARKIGAFTIGISCNSDAEITPAVDLAITPVVGPEVLSGSTRLKAGTATKLVLNMLSTGAMVQLGKTFGNLMVDLRATNSKLRARANRIVRLLTGVTAEEAEALLQQCGGEVKTALVVQRAGLTPEMARRALESAGGRVSAAEHSMEVARAGAPPEVRTTVVTPRTAVSPCDLVLGVDGGGSHTIALLAVREAAGSKSLRLVGRGAAGPSNMQAVGVGQALQALDQAIMVAFASAGLQRGPVASACLGLAGADRPADRRLVQDWAREGKLTDRLQVTSDAAVLLAAGTPQGWGVALIAGTGSIAYGRNAAGQTARSGGWGYLFGDEGSAYRLVMDGLRAVAQAADGRGSATSLTACFLEAFHLRQPHELIPALYRGGKDRASLAALAPLVLESAGAGDAVARGIVQEGALELAATAAAVVRQLGVGSGDVPLALAGGVLLGSELYREALGAALQQMSIQANPVSLVHEPADGAVRLALAAAYGPL